MTDDTEYRVTYAPAPRWKGWKYIKWFFITLLMIAILMSLASCGVGA